MSQQTSYTTTSDTQIPCPNLNQNFMRTLPLPSIPGSIDSSFQQALERIDIFDANSDDFIEIALLFQNSDFNAPDSLQPSSHVNILSPKQERPSSPYALLPSFRPFQPLVPAFGTVFCRKRRLDQQQQQQQQQQQSSFDSYSCFSPTSLINSVETATCSESSVHSVDSCSSLSSMNTSASSSTYTIFDSISELSTSSALPEAATTTVISSTCKKESKDTDSESFSNTETDELEASRSKWSQADSNRLWKGILACGNEWRAIRKLFPTRSYDQVKDKGRRMLRQRQWKTGRTKFMVDDAAERARLIAQDVLNTSPNTTAFSYSSSSSRSERISNKGKKCKVEN